MTELTEQGKLNNKLLSLDAEDPFAHHKIEELIGLGAQVDAVNDEDLNCLMLMTKSGNLNAMEMLIRHKANLNAVGPYGTAMVIACKDDCREGALCLLIYSGADIELGSPMTVSAEYGNAEFIEILLNNGANPNSVNDDGRSALMLISMRGWEFTETYLMDMNMVDGDDEDQVNEEVNDSLKYEAEVIKLLLKFEANLNLLDKLGNTAIFYAAAHNHIQAIEVYMDHQKDNLDVSTWKNAMKVAKIHGSSKLKSFITNRLLAFSIENFSSGNQQEGLLSKEAVIRPAKSVRL